jgi:hypothetical protein
MCPPNRPRRARRLADSGKGESFVTPRFRPGDPAYTKDGRRYVVDAIEDGMVYCSSQGGSESEFALAQLSTEAEWAARAGGRLDALYGRLKQAKAFAPYKGPLDRVESDRLLAKAERLFPGILDFTAFTAAGRIVEETDNRDLMPDLSIVKIRAIFDAAMPQTKAVLLATLIGTPADRLVSASGLGDNLMRAMIDQGLAGNAAAFEEFRGRRRR